MCWERAGHYPLQGGVRRQQRETLGVAYLCYALARSNVAESSIPVGVDSEYGPAAPNGSRFNCGGPARRGKAVGRKSPARQGTTPRAPLDTGSPPSSNSSSKAASFQD